MIFNFLYFAMYAVRSTTVIYFFKYNLQREDQSMLERNAITSVAVGNHMAIPRGTKGSQKFIKRTGFVVMTYPGGIQWDDKAECLTLHMAQALRRSGRAGQDI